MRTTDRGPQVALPWLVDGERLDRGVATRGHADFVERLARAGGAGPG